jgi:uncharacterized protein (TIGR03437 family)
VNALIPNNLSPGKRTLVLVRDGRAGPQIQLDLTSAAPALFLMDASTAIVTAATGAVLTQQSPARAGDLVILYATGLGPTVPDTLYPKVPTAAAWIERLPELRILLNGVPVDAHLVAYAGVAPGFAGLYQLNLWLPQDAPPDPEIQLELGEAVSSRGIFLPVAPGIH